MNSTHPTPDAEAGLMKQIFTEPTSTAFTRWVGVINFWILIQSVNPTRSVFGGSFSL